MLTSRSVESAELSLDITKHCHSKLCVKKKYFALSGEEYFITDHPSHIFQDFIRKWIKEALRSIIYLSVEEEHELGNISCL